MTEQAPKEIKLTNEETQQVFKSEQPVQVSVLRHIATIVDMASKKGIFEGKDLADAGTVFNLMNAKVEAAARQVIAARPSKLEAVVEETKTPE